MSTGNSGCDDSYGLMDAVSAWSDCNRAAGRIYRVDETDPQYRRLGDTVEVFVRRRDLPWFEKVFDPVSFVSEPQVIAGEVVRGEAQTRRREHVNNPCGISLPHIEHGTCPGKTGQQVAGSGRIDGSPQLILPGPIQPKNETADTDVIGGTG